MSCLCTVHVRVGVTLSCVTLLLRRLAGTVNSEDMTGADSVYKVPHAAGCLRTFESPSPITVRTIIGRILDKRDSYTQRYENKAKKEADYIAGSKQFVEEA